MKSFSDFKTIRKEVKDQNVRDQYYREEIYKVGEIQESKQLVIDALDKLESFKTYVQTDMGYKVTNPEGYVLHHNGDMIKLVNRIEFSYINFTLAKSWK